MFASLDISGDIDVDGTTNLDVVDIDGVLTQDGGAVFNEDSADVDFRVESNGSTHALFVDGATGSVGFSTVPKASTANTVQIGTNLSLLEDANSAYVAANAYDNSGWKYTNSQLAGLVRMGTNDGIFSFSNAASGSADAAITWAERMRIQAAGGISFNGDTAAANALDDYEEGTWTPAIGNMTLNSGTLAFDARYTKVGNLVTVSAFQTGGNITWTASKYLTGLPFAPVQGAGGTFTNSSPNAGGQVMFWTNSNIYFAQAGTSYTSLIVTGIYYV